MGRWLTNPTRPCKTLIPGGRNPARVMGGSTRGQNPYPSVSTKGGFDPAWSPAGVELFYRKGNRMMVVTVETEPEVRFSKPKVLFEGRHAAEHAGSFYTVSPDGQRFVMLQGVRGVPHFKVVLNLADGLEPLVPTN